MRDERSRRNIKIKLTYSYRTLPQSFASQNPAPSRREPTAAAGLLSPIKGMLPAGLKAHRNVRHMQTCPTATDVAGIYDEPSPAGKVAERSEVG